MKSGPLSEAELFDITHRRKPSAQLRALNSMGIDHKVRPDNTVLVMWEWVVDKQQESARDREGPRLENVA